MPKRPPEFDPALLQKHRNDSARDDGTNTNHATQTGRAIPDIPLAEARNHTPFPAQYYQTVDQHGQVFHVMALKVSYDMAQTQSDGSLAYATEQTELAMQDQWSGEVGTSSPLWESDYAPYKPQCDVLVVNAVSRPPPGEWNQVVGHHLNPERAGQVRQAKRWQAGIALTWQDEQGQAQRWHKQLTLSGPRSFGLLGLSAPELASEVPIDWHHAYGGHLIDPPEDVLHKDGSVKTPAGHYQDKADERNPVGRGLDKRTGQRLPQLETSALNPYHGGITQGRYPPVSLTPLARHWLPRRQRAGTYDNAWLKEQWPLPPLDFDYAYWNAAPEDQQIAYPPPGTQIHLANLYGAQQSWAAQHEWSGRLPMHELFVLWRLHNGAMPVQPLNLDTLVVNLHKRHIHATYRAVLSAKAGVRVVECRMEQDPERANAEFDALFTPHRKNPNRR